MPTELNENSSNSELVRELIEVLKKEATLFETFLELLEQQQKALVKNDIPRLNETTERQREKIIESGILAKKREALTRKLASEQDGVADITVSKLMDSVLPGQATVLDTLRETILDLNTRIMKMRTQNEMLINRSRENIVKTMELLSRIKAPNGGYLAEGKMSPSQTNLALDRI